MQFKISSFFLSKAGQWRDGGMERWKGLNIAQGVNNASLLQHSNLPPLINVR